MLMEADLPEDIEALRAFALEESRKLAEVMAAKGEADAEIERLQSIIDAFMRHRFGPRSEQLDPEQLQLGLEDVEIALGQARAEREAANGPARGERPRRNATTIASSASVRVVERGAFGPVFRSSTVALFRHFATVLGLIPSSRLSVASEACDRCIAARTACVVVAHP